MKALWNQRKVIVSEKDQTGAAIYNLGSADSGMEQYLFINWSVYTTTVYNKTK
jgi:hypothetical protein